MKNASLSLLLLGMLGAGFVAGSWYRPRETVSAAGARPRAVRYYVDPMHPAYTSDRPGIAPDCGMALQPVYEDDAGADAKRPAAVPGAVTLSAQQAQLIGVRVAAVDTAAGQRLRLYGHVAPDETRISRISVGIDGFLAEVSPLTTGSLVRKGEWLATFSAPEARASIQAYLVAVDVMDRANKGAEATAPVDFAIGALQQTADRLVTIGMSRPQIETIRQTRQVPAAIRITAPDAGFIVSRNVSAGQRLQRGDELYRLADLRRVWILADVPGADAAYIKPGATAQIAVAGRGPTLRGRVSSTVLPQFNAASQSVTLRIEVDNPGFVLRPEMFVDVDVDLTLPSSLAVPADAIVDSGRTTSVFVERAAGVFAPQPVDTGWRFGGTVEIIKGLQRGDRIAVQGAFLLDAERRIRATSPHPGSHP